MTSTVTIDLRQVGRGLDIPLRQIQAAVELLDEGNTVPFITRYRKDQTGGLDEEQIRDIQGRLAKLRLLADRKQTILRSIESQGKLTESLTKQILAATTTKRLEDLYLPFKPKKQTLATLARSRGLEGLAQEILEGSPLCADLDRRAADFVNPDRQVPTAADALLGAGHILAEQFSEQADLRQRLRDVMQRTGVLACSRLPAEAKPAPSAAAGGKSKSAAPAGAVALQPVLAVLGNMQKPLSVESTVCEPADMPAESVVAHPAAVSEEPVVAPPPAADETESDADPSRTPAPQIEIVSEALTAPEEAVGEIPAGLTSAVACDLSQSPPAAPPLEIISGSPAPSGPSAAERRKLAKQQAKAAMIQKRELRKQKAEEQKIKSFRDYFDYREEVRKIPPHRVLAINRGERARVLRVKLESDLQAMVNVLDELLVPPEHPHADYLRGCARDALARLILPSLERDVRRELTDRAETHAVGVFAKNLRNLFLQPPVRNRRILAVDPGFKSGCKLAALDEFGNLLGHDVIFLVGKPDRSDEARRKTLALIQQHQLTAAVIGNGTACRLAEDFFAKLVENELKERGFAYAIVNEAGASVYSTSRVGREELPHCDATLRGAISIGRRLLDPLSELVKIEPASIGVGLYQHDVKAKHLAASLDEVVESCVNFVGVEVNTASPALLRYVSGLNQLTARRLYEYRCEKGPFRNREQLREVPGLGEATFVQAAGFLKIPDGDNPLDATWIHPESYDAANRVLERLHGAAADLREKETVAALAERIAQVDLEALAKELDVGLLTLKDILAQLARPGRDPREDLPAPVFKQGVVKLEDLSPGMELTGTVLNVVDFGCFVDIGMHDSGLVHVSRLADKFVRDPHDVVAVGDIVRVWVMEIDKERRRVSLTMVRPGSEHPKPPHHGGRSGEGRPARSGDRPAGERSGGRPDRHPPRSAGAAHPAQPSGEARHDRPARPPRPSGRGRPEPPPRRPPYRPRPAPKPVTPITDAMKKGKEPMRTFGDLMQFFQQKPAATAEPDSAEIKSAETQRAETPSAETNQTEVQPAEMKRAEATPPAATDAPPEAAATPPAGDPEESSPEVS